MEKVELTVTIVAEIVAVASSLVAEFVPGWADWPYKRRALLASNMLVPFAAWALICLAALPLPLAGIKCGTEGLIEMALLGIAGALTNQGIYHIFTRDQIAAKRRDIN